MFETLSLRNYAQESDVCGLLNMRLCFFFSSFNFPRWHFGGMPKNPISRYVNSIKAPDQLKVQSMGAHNFIVCYPIVYNAEFMRCFFFYSFDLKYETRRYESNNHKNPNVTTQNGNYNVHYRNRLNRISEWQRLTNQFSDHIFAWTQWTNSFEPIANHNIQISCWELYRYCSHATRSGTLNCRHMWLLHGAFNRFSIPFS